MVANWLPIEIDLSLSYEHFASTYAVHFKALSASCAFVECLLQLSRNRIGTT
jgi:hypothetical protein